MIGVLIMKLKALLFICCFSLFSSSFAENIHSYKGANNTNNKSVKYPGTCEIEIQNYSYRDVHIEGTFTNYKELIPFNYYYGDSFHYIDMYDYQYGYCTDGITLSFYTLYGSFIYNTYVPRYSIVKILPFMSDGKPSIQIQAK